MSSKLLFLVFISALPGYHFEFPRDHFNHPDFETEWWYYTGNLKSADNHRYGFELTFFRQANTEEPPTKSVWSPDQLYLAHLALSDIDGNKFEHFERLNRAGPGLAGADFASRKYWNGNWHVQWTSDNGNQQLQAVASDFKLNLTLEPAKPFVINGVDGVSQKGPGKGQASHYVSFTRLRSEGTLMRDGRAISVSGTSWMDHEFFTEQQDHNLDGWDWFAIQLDNNEELMLYRLRLKSGGVSGYSSGTFVDQRGQPHHLTSEEFKLTPGGRWMSSTSRATYPLAWNINVPSEGITLTESTKLKQQELYTPGSVYLEMTGYMAPLHLGH
jgi:predicted secreted hydrolase